MMIYLASPNFWGSFWGANEGNHSRKHFLLDLFYRNNIIWSLIIQASTRNFGSAENRTLDGQ